MWSERVRMRERREAGAIKFVFIQVLNLRIRTGLGLHHLGYHLWRHLVLLRLRLHRNRSGSLILHLLVRGSTGRTSGSKICFGDIASPDARVAAHVLADDKDHEEDVVAENCWKILEGKGECKRMYLLAAQVRKEKAVRAWVSRQAASESVSA